MANRHIRHESAWVFFCLYARFPFTWLLLKWLDFACRFPRISVNVTAPLHLSFLLLICISSSPSGGCWNHRCFHSLDMICLAPEIIPYTQILPGICLKAYMCKLKADYWAFNFRVWPSFSVPHLLRLSPAAYYAQRMIQYLSRRESIRQRSLQNRLRTLSNSQADSQSNNPSSTPPEASDGDYEDIEWV